MYEYPDIERGKMSTVQKYICIKHKGLKIYVREHMCNVRR